MVLTPPQVGARAIYVVDDQEEVGRALSRLLRSAGHEARVYGSAEAFLEAGLPSNGAFLILDVRMPGLDGPGLFRRLRSMGSRLPVLFISAVENPKLREELMALGAVGWLAKPVPEEQLLAAIAAWERSHVSTSGEDGPARPGG